jgi:nucleoside-diphosphate-sugar epimerase
MRILITGGSGFIGTNLVEALRSEHELLNIDIADPRNPAQRAIWKNVDITRGRDLTAAVSEFQPDTVVHLAARTDLDGRSIEDYAANTVGVSNLIDAVSATGSVQRVLFASTRLVCKIGYQPRAENDYCPTTPYGKSKIEGERLVRAAKQLPPWVIFRPTSIWGPWFEIPYKGFFKSVLRGVYIHPSGRTVRKSFGFVGNSVHQLRRLLEVGPSCFDRKTMYLADYQPIEVRSWAENIRQTGGGPPIREVPEPILRVAAVAGDVLYKVGMKNPPLTSFRLDNLLTEMLYDTEPLHRIVGDLPYTEADGVRMTIDWLRSRAN